MAKPRETAPDPPVESEEDSGEEEASSEEEENESDSESEPEGAQTQTTPNAKNPPAKTSPVSKKPETQSAKPQTPAPAAASSSSEDEESGSETDSESSPKNPDPTVKPIASKPMDEPQKTAISTAKKPRSKPNASGPTSPTRATTSAGAKRAAAAVGDSDTKDPKRSKRKAAENSEKKVASNDEGRKLFARVWSEDDEIAILRGMIDYSAKKKADPVADLNAFHEFIKNKINIDVSRTQLQDKIRRLRKKYENNASKEKNGKERTFTNPHEQKAYDLSKKIWGSKKNGREGETFEGPKANGTPVRRSRSKGTAAKTEGGGAEEEVKDEKNLASEKSRSVSFVPDGRSIEEWVLKDGMEFMEEEDRVEMEKKWKQYRTEETGFLVTKLELTLEHAKKVFKGLKSSGD